MKSKRSTFVFILLFFTCLVFTNITLGIEINPTEKQVEKAAKYGKVSPGNIFNTDYVKPATFGQWPSLGGGLVKSKLVQIAVISAMKIRAKKKLTEEETQVILETKDLKVSYRGGDDVYKIKLRQGFNIIEPTKFVRPDMSGKDPSKHALFFTASFPYSELNLDAITTVVVEKDFGTKQYKVDFADVP